MPETQPKGYDWSSGSAKARGSFFKSEFTPVSVQRHDRKASREKRLETAYKVAEKRDRLRCRVTSKRLERGAVNAAERLEHHHLRKRSLSKARREDATNIICVSKMAHDLLTAGWIECDGTDGRKPLFFSWTPLAKSKPLIIKRCNPKASV